MNPDENNTRPRATPQSTASMSRLEPETNLDNGLASKAGDTIKTMLTRLDFYVHTSLESLKSEARQSSNCVEERQRDASATQRRRERAIIRDDAQFRKLKASLRETGMVTDGGVQQVLRSLLDERIEEMRRADTRNQRRRHLQRSLGVGTQDVELKEFQQSAPPRLVSPKDLSPKDHLEILAQVSCAPHTGHPAPGGIIDAPVRVPGLPVARTA